MEVRSVAGLPKCSIGHCCTEASLKPKRIDDSNPQVQAQPKHISTYFPTSLASYLFHIIFYKNKYRDSDPSWDHRVTILAILAAAGFLSQAETGRIIS